MIQPLRTRHLWTFGVLAIALPLLFIAALRARPAATRSATAPRTTTDTLERAGKDYRIRLALTADRSGPVRVTINPDTSTSIPDVLIYCSPDGNAEELNSGASFVGPLRAGASYPLRSARGSLLFYSVARQQLVDTISLGGQP